MSKLLGWVVAGILVVLLWGQMCNTHKGKNTITQLELDKQKLDSVINEQGQQIFTQNSIITDNTQSLNELTDSIFDLKKKDQKNLETIAYFKNVTKVSISKVDVPYLDTAAMLAFEDSITKLCPVLSQYVRDSAITVPVSAQISNPNFNLGLTVKKQGVTVDELVIPDTLQLRFVEHKRGLFKPNTVEAQFFHSNPLIQNLSANSVYYKPKKKSFLQRVVLPVAVGLGAGLLLAK